MIIFGKHADASVIVSGKDVSVNGSLDAFSLGPLAVSGTKPGTPVTASAQIGPTTQQGSFDGSITLFERE
jgi:hypothetical protein